MHNTTRIRRRGRPRQFDELSALQAAQRTFLSKGYSAATLDDLSRAMQINRPSLYAAFTDKETLYRSSLDLYAKQMEQLFRSALSSETEFAKALCKFYWAGLEAFFDDEGRAVGCMVACTAITEAVENDSIKRQTKSIMDEIDAILVERIARAQREGELPESIDVPSVAKLAVGVMHSLALRARSGASRRVLSQFAADAAEVILRGCRAPACDSS